MASVLLQVHAASPLTAGGRVVGVVGNVPELGAWNIADAIVLKPHGVPSLLWDTTVEIDIGTVVEYKYVILDRTGKLVLWESLPGNRTLVAGGINLALHKPCSQSSIFVAQAPPVLGPRVPELAVNGNTSGHFEMMCCRTNKEDQPFWQVDLLTASALNKIVLWNRQDMFQDRIVPVWLLVSPTPFHDPSLDAAKQQAIVAVRFDAPASRFEWTGATTGRYIRVQREGQGVALQFAELQAFSTAGVPSPVDDGWFGLDARALGDGLSHIDGHWLAPGREPELRLIFGSFDKKPSVALVDKTPRAVYLRARVVGTTTTVHHPYHTALGALDASRATPRFDRDVTGNAQALPSPLPPPGLANVRLLARLPPAVLADLAAKVERVELADGERLLAIGQERRALHVIEAGQLLLQGPSTTEGTHTFIALAPGAYTGELALVSGGNRSVQAVAKGRTTLLRLHRADFAAVLASHELSVTPLLAAHAHEVATEVPLLAATPAPKTPFVTQDTLQVFRLTALSPSAHVVVDVVDVATDAPIGSSVLVASQLHRTNGALSLPLLSPAFDVVGELLLRYLHVRPFAHESNTLAEAFRTQWLHGQALDMGHRGLGRSYYQALGYRTSHIRENTLSSFVVAGLHGADWIEFDVQLSKDRVPVIYHDFFFKAALEDRRGRPGAFTKTGLHDLTLAQLQTVEWRHGKQATDVPRLQQLIRKHWYKLVKSKRPPPATATLQTPLTTTPAPSKWAALSEQFPTLENLLRHVPPYVGLNIEIKYPVDPPEAPALRSLAAFEMNAYLDDILACVFAHANGRRNIVFSCFEPDVCVMLRAKQVRYPVFFLTSGVEISGQVPDVRTLSLATAVPLAHMEGLQGIVTNSQPLFPQPRLIRCIRDLQLHLWTWGNHNTGHAKVQFQKKHGISGVISDNVGDLTKADGKVRPRDAASTVS
ncbi:glycerophosphodiesterase [Achlya hypogyna]|uniref:Glycerophosphodiesterase n=1 Tax=Achlya hypogyna TaxID=1202772 RepID=A0A1V9Z288_ACHHY|nr:glycerophosphodiesterase [Achlya hypogyna]